MIVESFAMSVIILLILFIFVREKRFEYAKTAGILLILPGSYLVGIFASIGFYKLFSINRNYVVLLGTIMGLIASCLLIGLMAYHIKKSNLKLAYIFINGIFILVIGIIMIFDTIFRVFINY